MFWGLILLFIWYCGVSVGFVLGFDGDFAACLLYGLRMRLDVCE